MSGDVARGDDDQEAKPLGEGLQIGRRYEPLGQRYIGQKSRICMSRIDCLGGIGFVDPDSGVPVDRAQVAGERGAPGAATEDADFGGKFLRQIIHLSSPIDAITLHGHRHLPRAVLDCRRQFRHLPPPLRHLREPC